MSSLVPETGFTNGASGPSDVYPPGLGMIPAYLAGGASASATASLASSVITGAVVSAGTVSQGSGFTSSRSSAGVYVVTFTTAFAISPTVTITPDGVENIVAILSVISTTAFTAILTAAATAVHTDSGFNFVAVATQ